MSTVGISCPERMMPESTEVVSFFLSSKLMRVRPVPSQTPFRNSILAKSRLFLYSSICTKAFATEATASFSAGSVEFWILGGTFSMMKNDISVCPSSDLPEPFGPKRFRIGKERVERVTISRNSVASKNKNPIRPLSPNTLNICSENSVSVTAECFK